MDNKMKVVKTAKVCGIISKIACFISGASCLTFILLAIILPINGAVKSATKTEVAIAFSVLAIYALIMIGLFWVVEKLFTTIEKMGTPFFDKVNRYLKKIAVFTLILSCIPALVGTTLIHALAPNSVLEFRIELVGMVMSAVLFLIGQIFVYGKELQQKDDETL